MSKLSNNQGCAWKFNHKHKSRKGKIPSNRYTIILNECSHDSYSHRPYGDRKDSYYKKPDPEPMEFDDKDECDCCEPRHEYRGRKAHSFKKSRPEPMEFDISDECEHCVPRSGELVINGGFENRPDPFFGWVIRSGVELINSKIGEIAHQGVNAVRLGSPHPYAILYQDVPGICPGIFYQLNFYLSAATEYSNAPLTVCLEFLDQRKNLLARPALQLQIPADSLSSVAYTGFNNSTKIAAPPDTRFARISFEINTHYHPERHVHLDDVSLIAIWTPKHGK